MIFAILVVGSLASANCDQPLRDTSYRSLPVEGRAKDSMVDYKLINQLLMSLQRAVTQEHPIPEGFNAKILQSREYPVGGVQLVGRLPPGHKFSSQQFSLGVEREGLAIVATLKIGEETYEQVLSDETFSRVFPFRQPAGRGMLLSLSAGVVENSTLEGWARID